MYGGYAVGVALGMRCGGVLVASWWRRGGVCVCAWWQRVAACVCVCMALVYVRLRGNYGMDALT